MVEVWKDVVGYEDYFRVSNFGKVYSKDGYGFGKQEGIGFGKQEGIGFGKSLEGCDL